MDSASCRGAIFCARTFTVLSDSELRMDYMAVPWIYLPHDAVVFFVVGVFFFRRSRLFLREATFFRNGEGGEWRASRVTVGVKAKDNGEACFTLDFDIMHTIGRQPSPPHRGDFLFFSIYLQHTHPSLLRLRRGSYYMRRRLYFRCTPQKQAIISVFK